MTFLLEARGIAKTYPGGVVANTDVNLQIRQGEIHAVVGENGAGKSTLMKMLFGLEQPSAGEILLEGKPVVFPSPAEAIGAGIGMVFQHFSLVPSFSVYENVVMGAEPRRGIHFDRRRAIEEVSALAQRYRLGVDPLPAVSDIPVGQQQRVEILKVLYREAKILILDEPTAVLAPQEVDELFVAIRALVARGHTVIFIAHKLPEVLEISDRITVLRAGRTVATVEADKVTEDDLARMMVGRDVALKVARSVTANRDIALEAVDLTIRHASGQAACEGVSFRVRKGEIVGLVGVEGNGQHEVMEAISGMRALHEGNILLGYDEVTRLDLARRRDRGLAIIPPDRLAEGLAAGASVAENMVATRLDDPRFVRRGLLDLGAIRANAKRLIERYSIRASGPDVAAGTLSGGNMQKIVVARELSTGPGMILVSQPTRGVDLGATQFIWEAITAARDGGAGVLLCSTDLSEMMALSDRYLVFYHGQIVAALDNTPEITAEDLGLYMLGLAAQSPEKLKAGTL